VLSSAAQPTSQPTNASMHTIESNFFIRLLL
jgi:hypothetical protein